MTVGSGSFRPRLAASSGDNGTNSSPSSSSPASRVYSGRVVMWYGLSAHLSAVASVIRGMVASTRKRGKTRSPTRLRREVKRSFLRESQVSRTSGARTFLNCAGDAGAGLGVAGLGVAGTGVSAAFGAGTAEVAAVAGVDVGAGVRGG